MNDHRLQSAHLRSPRRELFRRRNEASLISYGTSTRVLADRAPRMSAGVLLLDGALRFQLHVGRNSVGRDGDNDVVIQDCDLFVSRRHCAIVVHTNGAAEIYDLASLNGTFVNGERVVDRAPIRSNDRVTIGGRVGFDVTFHNVFGN